MNIMSRIARTLLMAAIAALPATGNAAILQFVAELNGANETGGGDPDGMGTAMLWIDDTALTVTWDIQFSNIDLPLTGAHIHSAPAGVIGSVVVNFSAQASGSDLFDDDLASVLANPSAFYVNLHNSSFPTGAIRGQLAPIPEPAAWGMMLTGLGLLGWRSARRGQETPTK
jgi:hypothetical protein